MSTIVKLDMVFDTETMPDFGDITFDKNGNLMLTNSSVVKLITNLTRDVCGAAFNLPVGTQAFVLDTGESYIYHVDDRWYLYPGSALTDIKYGCLRVCIYSANGSGYILGDDEKIVFSIINNDNEIVLSKTMLLPHYAGNGIYSYWIDLEDAHTLSKLGGYTISVRVYSNGTDITDTLTIQYPAAEEWYDVHIKYDNG